MAADERKRKNRRWEARERGKTHNQAKINGCRETEENGIGIQIRSRGEKRVMADDETDEREKAEKEEAK